MRLAAHRLAYFGEPWNVFDFVVVGIALIPASGPLAVLRALRLLRLITLVPSMKRVLQKERWEARAGASDRSR